MSRYWTARRHDPRDTESVLDWIYERRVFSQSPGISNDEITDNDRAYGAAHENARSEQSLAEAEAETSNEIIEITEECRSDSWSKSMSGNDNKSELRLQTSISRSQRDTMGLRRSRSNRSFRDDNYDYPSILTMQHMANAFTLYAYVTLVCGHTIRRSIYCYSVRICGCESIASISARHAHSSPRAAPILPRPCCHAIPGTLVLQR